MLAKGVIFDLFGTLVQGWSVAEAKLRIEELAVVLEVPSLELEVVMEATYTERANGSLGPTRDMLERLCSRIGSQPSASALERGTQLRVEQFRSVLSIPLPEVPQLLRGLRQRGIHLGLISDCSAETPLIWPRLPWAEPIEAALFSWAEGIRKPAPQLYLKVAQLLEIAPADCLYIGDGGSYELSGAEAVGMRAARLRLPRDDGGVPLQFDPDPDWSGQEITDLKQVWGLLG